MQTQKSVVVKKAQQRDRGKLQHQLRRRGPHRRTHWHQVKIEKVVAVFSRRRRNLRGSTIRTPWDFKASTGFSWLNRFICAFTYIRQKTRAKEIAALGEEMIQTRPAKLQTGRQMLHAERHRRTA